MKKRSKAKVFSIVSGVVFVCAMCMLLASCSSGGDGTTSLANPYGGSSTVQGGINLSSLISSDQTALSDTSGMSRIRGKRRYYTVDPATEAVKLFVIGEDGELEDTGITCTCEADPNNENMVLYTCPGVKDGINYIVKYVKLLGDDRAIELKANAYVPQGGNQIDVTVTAQTSAIVECLTTAILEATEGTGISQDIVNQIISAVKTAIEQLVSSGAIQIPSMIVEVEGDTIAEVFGEETQNENLSNTSGTVVSDPNVSTNIDIIKNEIQSSSFSLANVDTDAEKAALIQLIFKEMLEDGGVPSFMLDFFTDLYIDNEEITAGDMTDAIIAGIEYDANIIPPELEPNAPHIIEAFRLQAVKLYDLLDKKAAGTLTEEEKQHLADIPPVVMGLFPVSERTKWETMDADTFMIVPQAIAYTIYVVDGYLMEQGRDYVEATQSEGGEMDYRDPFEFNPMDPNSIMGVLGFFSPSVAPNYLIGLDITWLELHPGMTWIEGTGEVDALNAYTSFMDLDALMEKFINPNAASDTDYMVTLTYPKKTGGSATIELVSESALRGEMEPNPFDNCWILNPWEEANPMGCSGDCNQPVLSRIVSDFTSGTYTVRVITPSEELYTRSFSRKVITGMTNVYPQLVSPKPQPIWPGDDAPQSEKDAYFAASATYVASTFNVNVDIDDPPDNIPDKGKVTIIWKSPILPEGVVIPEGVKMGYELDVGQGNCDPNGCYWRQIYATWHQDKILFGTSFTLPVLLDRAEMGVDDPYHVNMHIVFIDAETGEHLGQGGNCHAQFYVGDPLNLDNTFTITGPVSIRDSQGLPLTLSGISNLKAMFFREVYDSSDPVQPWKRTVLLTAALQTDPNGIIYTLQPTLRHFLDPNFPSGSWVGIDILHDIDNDNARDESIAVEPWYEPTWGPWWDADYNVWFNTWGGLLRVQTEYRSTSGSTYTETIVTGGEVITGPEFMVQLWYDPNTTLP